MANYQFKFQKNILIEGKLVCETGLHIGGASENLEIGGIDNPVIIDPKTRLPMIPGSSLKGRIRTLIELKKGVNNDGSVHSCRVPDCIICTIFGRGATDIESGPTRLIVRDAFPIEETKKYWDTNENIVRGTEIKRENWINRITSEADLRDIERVPAGSEFYFRMVYAVYNDADIKNLKTLFEGMFLLEDSYLGGNGTRGYGKIKFKDIEIKSRDAQYYENGTGESVIQLSEIIGNNIDKTEVNLILQNWKSLIGNLK